MTDSETVTLSPESLAAYVPRVVIERLAAGSLPALGEAERLEGVALYANLSDLRPFREMPSEDGPAQAKERIAPLNTVLGILIHHVHHYGGSVISLGTTSLLAVFLRQDASELAVSSALKMRAAFDTRRARRAARSGFKGAIQIGLDKGGLTLAHVGHTLRSGDGPDNDWQSVIFLGDAIDRAIICEGVAQSGEVVAGPLLAAALGEALTGTRLKEGFVRVKDVLPLGPPELHPLPDVSADALRPYAVVPALRHLTAHEGQSPPDWTYATSLVALLQGLDHDDPEIGHHLQDYASQAGDIIEQHGGTLAAIYTGARGSQLHAVFNAPGADEEAEKRAVRSALALLGLESSAIRYHQIGIASGRVYVGQLGSPARQTCAVIGETVEFSAQLSSLAGPGQILLDGATHDSVRDTFDLRPRTNPGSEGDVRTLTIYLLTGQRPIEAALASLQAGEQAQRQSDHALALKHYDEALRHLNALPLEDAWQPLAHLWLQRGRIHLEQARFDDLRADIDEVRALAQRFNDMPSLLQAGLLEVKGCHSEGDYPEMARLAGATAQLAGEEGLPEELEEARQLQRIALEAMNHQSDDGSA